MSVPLYLGVLVAVLTGLDVSFAEEVLPLGDPQPPVVRADMHPIFKSNPKSEAAAFQQEIDSKKDGTWCKSDATGKINGCFTKKGNSRSYVWTNDESNANGVAMSAGGNFAFRHGNSNGYLWGDAGGNAHYGVPHGQHFWVPGSYWGPSGYWGPDRWSSQHIRHPAYYWNNIDGANLLGQRRGIVRDRYLLPGQAWPYDDRFLYPHFNNGAV